MNRAAVFTLPALALLAGCSAESSPGGDSFPEAPLTTLQSDHGAFTIEVRTAPEQPPTRGQTDVELRILAEGGAPRDDLSLTALPWMPAMGHGASTKPTIAPAGEGRYDILHVSMFMAGQWELRTNMSGPVEDSATIVFQIP